VQALEGAAQILDHDTLAVGFGNVTGSVALLALQTGVASLQNISGSAVIELRFRLWPLKYLEVLAIVLCVATGAIQVALGRVCDPPVIAFALRDQNAYLLVTREAA
jgi:hypothetical protein